MLFLTQGKTNWKFIGIVVVLAVIAGGGIWFLSDLEQGKPITPEENLTEHIEEKTADWQTYRNEEYGFEINYPEDLSVIKNRGYFYGPRNTQLEYIEFSDDSHRYSPIGLVIHSNLNNSSSSQWVEEYIDYPDSFDILEKGELFIGGEQGIKIIYAQGCLGYNVFVSKKNHIYIFKTCETEFTKSVFDQILSTFRFIEEDKTTGWQTYRNNDLGVAFKYPEEWKPEECINLAKYSKDIDSHCDLWINFISPDGNIFYKSKPEKNVSLKDYFCPAVKSHPYSILYPWNTYDPWEINSPLYCSEVQVDTGYKGVVKNIIIWTTKPCPPPPIPCGDVDLYYSQYLNIFHIYLNSQDYPVLMVAKKWGRECFEERCGELTEPGEKLTYCMKEAYDECKKANKTELEIFDNLIKTIQIF